MNSVIDVSNLTKAYPLPKKLRAKGKSVFEAVRGVSFQVEEGEIFGILGPNGAGKTTTLSILEGLKQPSSGKVVILGYDALKEGSRIKKLIGVQLQTSEYPPLLTLKELLELFASLYGRRANTSE